MRLPWRRRPPAPAAETAPPRFDVSIDIERAEAVEAVRAAVQAIPGAGWVSVEAHHARDVRLYPAGSSQDAAGSAWDAARRLIEREVAAVLDRLSGWTVPETAAGGFAEALAPNGFDGADATDALAQLAALARAAKHGTKMPAPAPIQAPPPPMRVAAPAPKPEQGDDVARLARLLALVLPDAGAASAAAIRRFGSYAAVLAAPEVELRRVPGLGTHSVAAIKLVHAAAIRLARAGVRAQPVLADRQRLLDYLAAALARERIEQFRILFLDDKGMLQADEVQAKGTVNHTPVYPREVVRRALTLGASAIVLVHNHPSGDPAPSREDIDMTRQVHEAAAIMHIALRDHLIVGNGRWLSFREEGLLT